MTSSIRAELIPCAEVDTHLIGEWRDLVGRAAEPNPWFEPHIVIPLAAIRTDIVLVVVRSRAGLLACLPVIPVTRAWHGVTLPMWLTPHPMGTPLLDRAEVGPALATLFCFLAKAGGPRFLTIQEMGAAGPVAAAVTNALVGKARSITTSTGEWPALHRRRERTYLDESLTQRQRKDLRRCRRLLEADLGGELRLVDRAGEPAAVERFLHLEAAGWKGRKGTALACDPRWADYFRFVCSGFADEGRLQVLCLETGGTTVAMKVMTRAGDGVFELRTAYDERFARFSPGVLLEAQAIDAFHDGDDAWLMTNTNHPTSPLLRLWPDRCVTTGLVAEWEGAATQVLRVLPGIARDWAEAQLGGWRRRTRRTSRRNL